MRLHHLRVQALQAFAGTVEVDFDALADAGLYLLHGDTGAGKTTLLDAICLALFGRLPGERGTQARPRSDHAAPDVLTQVTLELTLRGERVRITRSPEQERPKIRGTGTTVAKAKILLEAVQADGATRVMATGHDEAAAELDRLLGMSREQFCQVVLLPQGQFATFLHARSDQREELLARLFGAERFEQAERWLTERRRQAEESVRASLRLITDSASCLSDRIGTPAPAGWEDDPGMLRIWVAQAQVLAEADLATADGLCRTVRDRRAATQAALVAAQAQLALRARHAGAVTALERLTADAQDHEQYVRELADARAAGGVAPVLQAAAADAALAADAATRAAAALEALPTAEPDPSACLQQAATHRTSAGEVGGLAGTEAEIVQRALLLKDAAGEHAALRATVAEAGVWLEQAEARVAQLTAAADVARIAVAQAAQHAQARENADERLAAARRRDELALTLDRLRFGHAKAITDEQDARDHWLDVRQARLDGMAGELAADLQDGEPCVVCGALEHPEPAAHLVGGQIDATVERAAQDRAQEQREVRDGLGCELADSTAAHAGALALAGDGTVFEIAAAAARARDLDAATAEAATRAPAAVAALTAHAGEQEQVKKRQTAAGERLAALQVRIDAWDVAQKENRRRLRAALGDSATVADRVTALEELAVAYETASRATEAGEQTAAAAERSGARAVEAALDAGFMTVAAARQATLDPPQMSALQDRVQRYEDAVAQLRHRIADPELLTAVAADAPDEEAMKATARAATEADADAERQLERARGRAEALSTLSRELERRLTAYAPLAAGAAQIRALAMIVDGSSAQNRMRVRLRAYVLAMRLEEIAAAASVRLEAMTAGRFTLSHDDERASRGVRSGLGLRVLDGWTGQDRHPSSLSGGETFLASLALALGLADVVAAEAGGARLDTLFVDEGFGSLDERSLDEVLDVLDRLRDGGRAVGVVSHVPELRQRITAQVHVVKGRAGSQVQQTA